jgi:hypothetical protein
MYKEKELKRMLKEVNEEENRAEDIKECMRALLKVKEYERRRGLGVQVTFLSKREQSEGRGEHGYDFMCEENAAPWITAALESYYQDKLEKLLREG